jgi:hypothetical protein
METTAANVHDITKAAELIRDDDEVVYGVMRDILALRNGKR